MGNGGNGNGNGLFTWFVGSIDQEFVWILGSDVFTDINRGVHDRSYKRGI